MGLSLSFAAPSPRPTPPATCGPPGEWVPDPYPMGALRVETKGLWGRVGVRAPSIPRHLEVSRLRSVKINPPSCPSTPRQRGSRAPAPIHASVSKDAVAFADVDRLPTLRSYLQDVPMGGQHLPSDGNHIGDECGGTSDHQGLDTNFKTNACMGSPCAGAAISS